MQSRDETIDALELLGPRVELMQRHGTAMTLALRVGDDVTALVAAYRLRCILESVAMILDSATMLDHQSDGGG